MTLAEIKVGQDAVLRTIGGQGELRHHLLDMGLTPGTEVTLRKVAPMGDPIEVELRGYELTLRLADAAKIEVDNVHETDRAARSETRHAPVPHPGVGELRKAASYHDRKAGSEIAKGQPLRFALAGNQNCGKTTLFNQLTVVLLCSLMIPLRRYNFNEKREETTGFIKALGRRKTRPPQSRNRLRGKLDSLPSQRYDSWLFHALLHHTAPCRHR